MVIEVCAVKAAPGSAGANPTGIRCPIPLYPRLRSGRAAATVPRTSLLDRLPNARRTLADQYHRHDLYLAADRAGDLELAVGVRRRQSLQPHRRSDRRLSLPHYRTGAAADPLHAAEFWRDRYFTSDPDSAAVLPADIDQRGSGSRSASNRPVTPLATASALRCR